MFKLYISPSSQFSNVGLAPFTNEGEMMNKVADQLVVLVGADGRFDYKRNSPSMGVYEMAAASNEYQPDIHVAIHSNAGGGEGTEVYAYGSGTNSERLATCLYEKIAPLSPGEDRGVKYNKGLVEIGDSVHATSALIELGFHDNQTDATWEAYNPDIIARGLYEGICDYFGIGYKDNEVKVAPVRTEPEVVAGLRSKAKVLDLLNQLVGIVSLEG